jgi:hypothetical protein
MQLLKSHICPVVAVEPTPNPLQISGSTMLTVDPGVLGLLAFIIGTRTLRAVARARFGGRKEVSIEVDLARPSNKPRRAGRRRK